MSQRDNLMAGRLYHADAELRALLKQCKCTVFEINHLHPAQQDEKLPGLLSKLFGTANDVFLEPPFYCDYGINIHWGKDCYCNTGVTILDVNPVRFGDNVFIAPNVVISAAYHPVDPELRKEGEYGLPVTIGNDVWIGAGAIINPGVTIGDGVTIGAGAVVTKDIPPYTVAAGVPCRVIKHLRDR